MAVEPRVSKHYVLSNNFKKNQSEFPLYLFKFLPIFIQFHKTMNYNNTETLIASFAYINLILLAKIIRG